MRKHEKKYRVFVCFMDLEKAHSEALCRVLRLYNVCSKLLIEVKSMNNNSVAWVRVNVSGSRVV